MLYWNGTQWVRLPAGSNGQILTLVNGIPAWQQLSSPCGFSITINHLTSGGVAPVNKLVTYGTVTNIPGESLKCWFTSNLGSDHQATAVNDATETSAGWYWQFNRKQGYKHDGSTRTPNTTWVNSINELSEWTANNDPCTIEVGGGWRIPTWLEWINVDSGGGWTTWTGPWNSALKLHAAGTLKNTDGSLLNRGSYGYYWSDSDSDYINGMRLSLYNTFCALDYGAKTYGNSLRCIRD
jgi:hypothetical protein